MVELVSGSYPHMLVSPVKTALWIKCAACEPRSPHRAVWDRYAVAFAAEVRQGSEQFLENDSAAELGVRVMSLLPKRAACIRRYSAGSGTLRGTMSPQKDSLITSTTRS